MQLACEPSIFAPFKLPLTRMTTSFQELTFSSSVGKTRATTAKCRSGDPLEVVDFTGGGGRTRIRVNT